MAMERLVVVIDSDNDVRRQTVAQLTAAGFPTRDYASAEEFVQDLNQLKQISYFCIVTELTLPGINGLVLQQQMLRAGQAATFVFYAASIRVRQAVRAMREGAVAVVEKGDGIGGLLDYVEEAVERSRVEYVSTRACAETVGQLRALSNGEQEVLQGIMSGKLNKEIAQELNLSIRTIEQRRREVFKKLDVQHPASLACKVMEVITAHESRPERHEEDGTEWLLSRVDEPGAPVGWRRHQAHWARAKKS